MSVNSDFLDDDITGDAPKTSEIQTKEVFVADADLYNPKGLHPDAPTASDGPLGEQIPGELPKTDIKFKIVDSTSSKIAQLQDIEAQILGEDSQVSQETFSLIADRFEGFKTPTNTLAHYTKKPSGFNASYVKNFIRQQISLESSTLYENLSSLVKDYFYNEYNYIKDFLDNRKDDFLYQLQEFCQALEKDRSVLSGSPNLVVATQDKDFVNVYTKPFAELKNLRAEDDRFASLLISVSMLGEFVEKKSFSDFLAIIRQQGDARMYFKPSSVSDQITWSFKEIYDAFAEQDVAVLFNELLDYYSGTYLNEQQPTLTALDDLINQDAVTVALWFTNNAQQVYAFMEQIHRVQALLVIIPAMMIALKTASSQALSVA